jgi:hypothetical protein
MSEFRIKNIQNLSFFKIKSTFSFTNIEKSEISIATGFHLKMLNLKRNESFSIYEE